MERSSSIAPADLASERSIPASTRSVFVNMIRSYCTTWTRFPNGSWKSRGPGQQAEVVDHQPEVPVLAGAGREERDELVAEVEKGAAVGALDAAELEQTGVEGDRGLDVVDLERDVVDADGTGEGGHARAP